MQEESKPNKKEYVVAFYIRLSREDRDLCISSKKTESNSITNQRRLLWDYIKKNKEFSDCKVIEKCDDGYSGVTFDDRPQFMELIELAKKRKIQCILVKDFSRFGRNYVELGNYLEQFFPFLGIRFISVNDHYDSNQFDGTTGGLDIAFKNMIYDFYSREFSKKQKLAWKRSAEQGEYRASYVLYGYQKAKENKHQLVIHEKNGKIVREIFELAVSGISSLKIAKMLNERGVLAPSEFHHQEGSKKNWSHYNTKCYWMDRQIRYILKDERYTGVMVSLKTDSIVVKGKRRKKPVSEWIRVEGMHEAIVSYELYKKANAMLKQTLFQTGEKKEKNLYFCGYCGRKLQKNSKKKLICLQRYYRKECSCREVNMVKAEVEETILLAIKQQIKLLIEEETISQSTKNKMVSFTDQEEEETLRKTKEHMKKIWLPLYEQYKDGKLSREDFLAKKKSYEQEVEKLELRLEELKKKREASMAASEQLKKVEPSFFRYMDQMTLTEEMKEQFIEKVIVYSKDRIEICWKFEHEF